MEDLQYLEFTYADFRQGFEMLNPGVNGEMSPG